VAHSPAIEPHIFENEQRETVTANAERHRGMLDNFLHPETDIMQAKRFVPPKT
jgi:hypothetical protein